MAFDFLQSFHFVMSYTWWWMDCFRSLLISNSEAFSILVKWWIGHATVRRNLSSAIWPFWWSRGRPRGRARAYVSWWSSLDRGLESSICMVSTYSGTLVNSVFVLATFFLGTHHIGNEIIKDLLLFLGPYSWLLNKLFLGVSNSVNSLNFLVH